MKPFSSSPHPGSLLVSITGPVECVGVVVVVVRVMVVAPKHNQTHKALTPQPQGTKILVPLNPEC